MRLKSLILMGFLVMTVGCAAGGSANRQADVPQEVDVKIVDGPVNRTADADSADPNEVICRRQHKVGSNFPRTVCKTRAQIEQERKAADGALRLQQQRNAAGGIDPTRGGM